MNVCLRVSYAVYAGLVRLYPPQMRDEFGAEMQAVFGLAATEATDRGWQAVAGLAWRELRDWPRAVLQAHRRSHAEKESLGMDNGTMTGWAKPRWPFYLGWVVLSAASIPIAWAIALAMIEQLENVIGDRIVVAGTSHITEDFLLSWVLFPVLGMLNGCLQYLVLRRQLPRMGGWIAATALGWAVTFVLILPVAAGVGREISSALAGFANVGRELTVPVSAALLGGTMALPQWWMLRRRMARAGWWVFASGLGWGMAGLVTGPSIDRLQDVLVCALIPPSVASMALWLLLDRLPGQETGGMAAS